MQSLLELVLHLLLLLPGSVAAGHDFGDHPLQKLFFSSSPFHLFPTGWPSSFVSSWVVGPPSSTIRFANFFAWPTIAEGEGLLPVHSDRIPHHWLYTLSVYGQDVIVAWSPKQTGTLLSSMEVTAHRPKLRINLNAIIWLISWTNALPSEHRSYCLLPPPPPSRVVIIMMMIIIFFWPP